MIVLAGRAYLPARRLGMIVVDAHADWNGLFPDCSRSNRVDAPCAEGIEAEIHVRELVALLAGCNLGEDVLDVQPGDECKGEMSRSAQKRLTIPPCRLTPPGVLGWCGAIVIDIAVYGHPVRTVPSTQTEVLQPTNECHRFLRPATAPCRD